MAGNCLSTVISRRSTVSKLKFLADIGVRVDDPGMRHVAALVMAHQSEQGPFQLSMAVSVAHGGTGK